MFRRTIGGSGNVSRAQPLAPHAGGPRSQLQPSIIYPGKADFSQDAGLMIEDRSNGDTFDWELGYNGAFDGNPADYVVRAWSMADLYGKHVSPMIPTFTLLVELLEEPPVPFEYRLVAGLTRLGSIASCRFGGYDFTVDSETGVLGLSNLQFSTFASSAIGVPRNARITLLNDLLSNTPGTPNGRSRGVACTMINSGGGYPVGGAQQVSGAITMNVDDIAFFLAAYPSAAAGTSQRLRFKLRTQAGPTITSEQVGT